MYRCNVLTIYGWRYVFVVLLRSADGQARHPFRRYPREARTGPWFVAPFVSSVGKKTIHNFHGVAGEIWKQRVPGDHAAGTKRERKRRLTAPKRRNDFPRCATGVH